MKGDCIERKKQQIIQHNHSPIQRCRQKILLGTTLVVGGMGIAGTHVAYAEGPETAAQTAAVVEKVAHSPSEAAVATSVDRPAEAKAEYAIESDIMIGEEAQDAALSEEGDASEAAVSEKETASENVSEEWEIAGDEVVVQVEKSASDNADKTDKSVEKERRKPPRQRSKEIEKPFLPKQMSTRRNRKRLRELPCAERPDRWSWRRPNPPLRLKPALKSAKKNTGSPTGTAKSN